MSSNNVTCDKNTGTDKDKRNDDVPKKRFRTCITDIIMKKRDRQDLSPEEIKCFVECVVNETIQDAQLGAMLMAIYLNGLNDEETTCLTRAMTHSGEVLEWPEEWKGKIVDKHSTGGVGDKVSLILAPALAACGMKVPMVSGRGLEHTGGTLDKLEAVPGFNVSLSYSEMKRILEEVGCCIVGQTSNLVPADKIMYATRDVTATVANIGLIVSSIISKKAAESLDTLVLDVKIGKGAFCKTEADARELATRMVTTGNGLDMRTVALLTSMDYPIGNMIGNALEVAESISCLHGDGPKDLMDLTIKLGGHVLLSAGAVTTLEEGVKMLEGRLCDGTAIAKFAAMMKAQGVERAVADRLCEKDADIMSILKRAKYTKEVKSPCSGFIHDIDALECAVVSGKLGAGRAKVGDAINHAVGLELQTAVGQPIEKDAVLVTIHHDDPEVPEELLAKIEGAFIVKPDPVDKNTSLLIDVVH